MRSTTATGPALLLAACAACGSPRATPADAAGTDGDARGPVDAPADGPPVDAPPADDGMLALSGAVTPVHDPSMIETPSGFYAFSTGEGLAVRWSPDLEIWSTAGQVFPAKPAWITTTSSSDPNLLWAPDISYFGGAYHLYYAASSFGSQDSCIGHATSPSLSSPVWTDRGSAVICSTSADSWNAIDPALVIDAGGDLWLALGSFWGGLKLIPLDASGDRVGTQMYSLATRANDAVEAPFIVRHGGYYVLFESVDYCCQGVNSTYKQMVGRSVDVTGPYVDRDGTPLLSGGGTLLVAGDARWKGPGHDAVFQSAGAWYNVYHAYDANAGGAPTMRIAHLTWDADGWPVSAGP